MARPLVRYHGGKWKLAPWIISHFPAHKVYVEPYGGGGSVLLRKPRCYAEIYNDLDGEIVNLFQVARDHGEHLAKLLELTPFARQEFKLSYEPCGDPIEQARRTLVRSFQGFGSASVSKQVSGFRANSNRSGTTPAHDWMNYPEALRVTIQRLRGIVIENRPAIELLPAHDGEETLFYVDPPYTHDTRSKSCTGNRHAYKHEMHSADHEQLALELKKIKGMVIVSGYRSGLYDALFAGWQRIDRAAMADGAAARVESLWLSPNMPDAGLFREAA
jgi:DNA adenine methylase